MATRSMETVRLGEETFIFRHFIDAPSLGVTNINSYLVLGDEPILIDTHAPRFRDQYFKALWDVVEPTDVRWIFVTHDDRDHVGNIMQLLERCPNAKLVTQFTAVARMSEEFALPMSRINFVNPGDTWEANGRTFVTMRPPTFDSPTSNAIFDPKTKIFFSADSFSAFSPREADDAGEVPDQDYVRGFNIFHAANSPWTSYCAAGEANKTYEETIARIRALNPEIIVPTHGPTVRKQTERVLALMSAVPSLPPFVGPSQRDLEAILAGMRPR